MTKKKAVKREKKLVYPYTVKVLRFQGKVPQDILSFPCRNKEEAQKRVSTIKRIVGKDSETAKHTHIVERKK